MTAKSRPILGLTVEEEIENNKPPGSEEKKR